MSDQRRVIINNKRLSGELLEELREEARCAIRLADGPRVSADERYIGDPIPRRLLGETETPYAPRLERPEEDSREEDELMREITTEFTRALTEFEGTDTTKRPAIPKKNCTK